MNKVIKAFSRVHVTFSVNLKEFVRKKKVNIHEKCVGTMWAINCDAVIIITFARRRDGSLYDAHVHFERCLLGYTWNKDNFALIVRIFHGVKTKLNAITQFKKKFGVITSYLRRIDPLNQKGAIKPFS